MWVSKYCHEGFTTHEMVIPWRIYVLVSLETKLNNMVNTAFITLKPFDVKQQDCWIEDIPKSIFG